MEKSRIVRFSVSMPRALVDDLKGVADKKGMKIPELIRRGSEMIVEKETRKALEEKIIREKFASLPGKLDGNL